MANYTSRTDKYFVAKVSMRNQSVEYVNVSNISGAISFRSEMESGSYDDPVTANKIAAHLNGIYEELGLEIYCYRVASAETNNHAIANAPQEYQDVVRRFFGEEPDTPEEEEEEEEATEGE